LKGKVNVRRTSTTLRLGCFGHFRSEDRVCRHHCAIRIRCAIERDQKLVLEVMSEMETGDDLPVKLQ
jgi:hypothetical protein